MLDHAMTHRARSSTATSRGAAPAAGGARGQRRRRHPHVPPGREQGHRAPRRRRAGRARAAPSGRRVRGHGPRREAAAALRARGRLPRGRHVHAARPVRVPADARRDRPVPRRRGPPRGALREARRARAPDRRRDRRRVRRLGAVGAVRQRRGRLQLVGRPAAPDALARLERHLGAVRPRRGRGLALQVRAPRPGRLAAAARRPVRVRRRGPAADGLGRRTARTTSGTTRSG